MLPSGRNEQKIAGLESILFRAVLENAVSADDDIDFVLNMGLLRIMADGPVYFDRHGAVAKEFEEGFIFVGAKGVQCLPDSYFHGRSYFKGFKDTARHPPAA